MRLIPAQELFAMTRSLHAPEAPSNDEVAGDDDVAAMEIAFGKAALSFLLVDGRPSVSFMFGMGRAIGEMLAAQSPDVGAALYEMLRSGVGQSLQQARGRSGQA